MALPGYELTPSQTPMREFRSLTTSPRGHLCSHIIFKAFFSAVNAVFGLLRTTPGFNGGRIRGGSGIICHSLFIIPAFLYPVIHDSFIYFFVIHDSILIALVRKLKTI